MSSAPQLSAVSFSALWPGVVYEQQPPLLNGSGSSSIICIPRLALLVRVESPSLAASSAWATSSISGEREKSILEIQKLQSSHLRGEQERGEEGGVENNQGKGLQKKLNFA